ncbi:MAG: LysR family transcriptional regulator [Oscillospiraceae bacterium]|nr:LysR family transcriptional regulator [Oscillospiraceae bacterium]
MHNKDIELFLDLVRTRNITKTADNLYTSQSAVSNRLKNLETELGCPLVVRSKGMRNISLTQQGEKFIPLAQRWQRMFEETAALGENYTQTLRIAANESTYFDRLEPVLTELLTEYPRVRFSLQITDSSIVYDLMENKLVDYGFASYESTRSKIIHRCIDSQSFYVAHFCETPGPELEISPLQLDPHKEVLLTGWHFSTVSLWREKWFGAHACGRVELNSPQAAAAYLKKLGGWIISPRNTIELIASKIPVQIYRLTDPPEERKIYLLTHENGENERTEIEKELEKRIGELFGDLNKQKMHGESF